MNRDREFFNSLFGIILGVLVCIPFVFVLESFFIIGYIACWGLFGFALSKHLLNRDGELKKMNPKIPKAIELSHGDRVNIYIRKRDILFDFYCDGTENCFAIPKKELLEMIK